MLNNLFPNVRPRRLRKNKTVRDLVSETKLLKSKLIQPLFVSESISEKHPLKRIGKASDVSNLVRFLLSDDSSWITGQIISVDGGMNNVQL